MNDMELDIDKLDFDKGNGLVPGVVQDAKTGTVLMLGYLNRESLLETLKRRRVVFFSRSRNALWEKGETSGNTLNLVAVVADCDNDALLLRVEPVGPTCHRNTPSCFGDGQPPDRDGLPFLAQLQDIIDKRIAESPEGSYVAKLYAAGLKRMAQKVGEEGVEVALAAQSAGTGELASEAADLLFHLALLLRARDLSLDTVASELAARHRTRERRML
jgi:phosphoribosyl-ATP pyrophosphohydrolase/phosphoribosyl-AMP cyclohydrolase